MTSLLDNLYPDGVQIVMVAFAIYGDATGDVSLIVLAVSAIVFVELRALRNDLDAEE